MSSTYTELDRLKQSNRELTEQLEIARIMLDKLEEYGISNHVDLVALLSNMEKMKYYKNRSNKYGKLVKSLGR